jgi:hypothetical protein
MLVLDDAMRCDAMRDDMIRYDTPPLLSESACSAWRQRPASPFVERGLLAGGVGHRKGVENASRVLLLQCSGLGSSARLAALAVLLEWRLLRSRLCRLFSVASDAGDAEVLLKPGFRIHALIFE